MNHALPQTNALIAGKYRVDATLGEGGMGVVFAATHVETERRVALKYLQPHISLMGEAVARFKLEARATGRINHPNVVDIYDLGSEDGHLYLVMEFLDGHPLSARLGERAMPASACCRVLIPAMRGVAAAHSVGVLHRDLKPANIFLARTGDGREVIKVLDFGIAKLTSRQSSSELTNRGVIVGTPEYMAPEQLLAQPDLDARCDVYALGVILFRMLTGSLPHSADHPLALAMQVTQHEAPAVNTLVPELPQKLVEVVARALSRDRAHRYPTIEAFARALEPFADGIRFDANESAGMGGATPWPAPLEGGGFRADTVQRTPVRSEFRLVAKRAVAPWRWVALAGLGLALSAAGAFLTWHGRVKAPPPVPQHVQITPHLAKPVVPAAKPVVPPPVAPSPVNPPADPAAGVVQGTADWAQPSGVDRPAAPPVADTRDHRGRPRHRAQPAAPEGDQTSNQLFQVDGVFGRDALMRPSFAAPDEAHGGGSAAPEEQRGDGLEPIAPTFGDGAGR